jgi:hypothetical protein
MFAAGGVKKVGSCGVFGTQMLFHFFPGDA